MADPRRVARSLAAATAGLSVLIAPSLAGPAMGSPAPRSAASENTWDAPQRPVIKDYREYSTVTMPSSGEATVFYGPRYRSYDPGSGTSSDWTTLAEDADAIYPVGNARGDLCARWFPGGSTTTMTVSCRRAGSDTWRERNYPASKGITSAALAVGHRGASAMSAWIDYRTASKIRIRFATFDAAQGTWSGSAPVPVAPGDGRLAWVSLVPYGEDGYALHYVRDIRIKHPREQWIRVATGTWVTTWTQEGGWTQPREVTMPLGDGETAPVTLLGVSEQRGDVAAAFVPAMEPWWYEHDPWIARLRPDATYRGKYLGYATTRPLVSISGGAVAVASLSPDEERLRLSVRHRGVLETKTFRAPVISGDQTRIFSMGITAQRMSDGAKGWSIALEINRTYEDDASESLEDIQYLYAVTSSIDRDTARLESSPIQRVGDGNSYDGLSPEIAGSGRQAVILYFQQDWQYVAFRRP